MERAFLFRFHAKFAIIYYHMVRTFYTHVTDTCLQNCTMYKHSRQSRALSSCFVFLLNSPMLVTLVCRLVQVDPSHFAVSTEGSVVLAE